MEIDQSCTVENFCLEKNDHHYSTPEIREIIDETAKLLKMGENSWHIHEIFTRHFSYRTKWQIMLFILNKSWRKNQQTEYAVIFCAEENEDHRLVNKKSFVDINGNFYTTIEEFLKISNVVSYHTVYDTKEIEFDDNLRFDYLLNLEKRFQRLFNVRGVELLQNFISHANQNAEEKLKNFKYVCSLFSNLLHLNADIRFAREGDAIYVINNNIRCQINFQELENYQAFHDFNYRLKTAFIQKFEFDLDTVLQKRSENKIRHDISKEDQKQRYMRAIEERFYKRIQLADKCQAIALRILKANAEIKDAIKLSEFIQMVYWVQVLLQKIGLEITQEKIELYVENFNDLLNAARNYENKDHKFVNHFSAAYHTNTHFDEFKSFHKLGQSRWIRLKPDLNPVLLDFYGEIFDDNLTMEDKNKRLGMDTANKCANFYLIIVANYVFDDSCFSCEEYKENMTNYIYRLDTAYGLKSKDINEETPFVVTIIKK